MRTLMVGAAVAAYLGTAGMAAADGMYEGSMKDAPVAPGIACAASQFAGKYVGGYVGFSDKDTEIIDTDYFWGGDSTALDEVGIAGGVQIGYDLARCNTVFGIVADFTLADNDREDDNYFGEYDIHTSMDWMSTLRVRGGIALDSTLLYLTGGLAFASFDHSIEYDYDYHVKSDETRVGYVVGAGIEHMYSHNISVFAEVLYAGFEEEEAKWDYYYDCCGEDAYRMKFDDEVILGKVGINFRFGERHEPLESLK